MEKRAAIYCRLSREDDNLACDKVSESIQNQQKLLCEYAKKNGYSFIRVNSSSNRIEAHKFYRHVGFNNEKDQKRFLKECNE